MDKFFYTFGSSMKFPYQNGWVEVHAENWHEAHEKFSNRFPDRHPDCLNCSFFYGEEAWKKMDQGHTWKGYKCYAVIE